MIEMFPEQSLNLVLSREFWFEHAFFVAVALLAPLIDRHWLYAKLVRASTAGVPHARARFYALAIAIQWSLVAVVAWLWIERGRSWEALGLGLGTPWRLAVGLVLAAGYVWMMVRARGQILVRQEMLAKFETKFLSAGALLPHTSGELRGFRALSLTAGVCEEVLYRGFVLWYLSLWVGWTAAIPLSAVLFGFAHCYLGWQDAVRTAKAGLMFGLLVLAAGSIWPAMVVHAAMDWVAGDIGFAVMRGKGSEERRSEGQK